MIRKRTLLLLLWIVGMTASIFSQKNDQNLIYKYTTDHGLSSNFIYRIIQDRQGFIWIGTEEGLNKFDGKSFTGYSTKKGRYCMSHNRAQALMLAPDGNIWAGTSYGINIYNYKSDSIIKVTTSTEPLKLPYNDITFLKMSQNQARTWIGTYGNGVHFFDWEKKEFHRLKLPKISGIPSPTLIMSLLEDDSKRLWIGTQNNGLYKYDLEQNKLEYAHLKDNSTLYIQTIFQDSYKRIWIGTSKGCYIYNETTNNFEPVNYPKSLNSAAISSIVEDKRGRLWLASDQFLMSFATRSFSLTEKFPFQFIEQGESGFALNCPAITSLMADRDNNIWIGTVWGGLNMLEGMPPKFRLYKHDADVPNSMPGSPASGISQDKKGDIWVTTNTKGVYKMNFQHGEFIHIPLKNEFATANFQTILTDWEGNIWLGTFKNGLIKLNKNGKEKAVFQADKNTSNSLPNNDIRCLCETRSHDIWIGTGNGAAMYSYKTRKIEKVLALNASVRTIKEEQNSVLWIGTYGRGIITYNQTNNYINYHPTTLNTPMVFDILISHDSIWLATHGQGLALYIPKGQKSRFFDDTNGLSSNYIRSIASDTNGSIWLGTSNGISKVNPKTAEIHNFGTQDGVQTQELSDRCALRLSDGQLVFGGLVGLNIFDPKNVAQNNNCPPVVFTKLSVLNQTITPTDDKRIKSPITENISIAQNIELQYNQSVFTIEFMGINYNATQKIQYMYLLDGSDSKWNNIGTQNSVTFRNLDPGKYIFKVKASSPDGRWSNSNIASITIVIRPPFWKTWWAYILYFIALSIIAYFIWQFLTVKIHSNNALKIERAKLEKEEELHQEKLQFFTNISHEFRTPLTLLIGPLEKMQRQENDDAKKTQMKMMLRNARRLLVMVNQLLDFRKAERGQMSLKVQYADLIAFTSEIMHSYDELKNTKNIQFEFHRDTEMLMTWFDTEFLDKCLFNLLSNAFKFTPDGGRIAISVEQKTNSDGKKHIEISVTDNGRGIPESEINQIFNPFFTGKTNSTLQQGSGIGLHLTKSLVELHHGTISVQSIPNQETTFTIDLPASRGAYLANELATENALFNKQITGEVTPENTIYEPTLTEEKTEDSKKRILLVEDNVEIRSYVIDILGTNYDIEEAENGLVGLKMAREKDYNLIITDLMMPAMDGIELCKQLKSSIETDHLPVIMLTAKSSIESRIEGLYVGADSYISKPFHPEHLVVRVAKLIEQRELFKTRFAQKNTLQNIQEQIVVTESTNSVFLQKTTSIVLAKMIEADFNGDMLANELGISRMGLHRKIKALTGQSTGEFIRSVRLKKACELLAISDKNISEVCYEVGFNSPSYFTTCFTETYKTTPTEYVKNLRKS